MNEQIELTDLVKDLVTGFEGVVTAITYYLDSDTMLHLEANATPNEPGKAKSFGAKRCLLITKGYVVLP